MDQLNKTPGPLPATPQNDSESKRTHFTPCRRLGLKRKSMNTPELVLESVTLTPNSNFKNHKHSFETPKRVIAFTDSTPLKSHTPLTKGEKNSDQETVPEEPKENAKCDSTPKDASLPTRRTPNFGNIIPSKQKILELQRIIKEKEDQLEELNSQLQEKNKDLDEDLSERTKTWRAGCQNALHRLHEKTKSMGSEITMTEMISKLGIPFDVINYDADLEDFQETE